MGSYSQMKAPVSNGWLALKIKLRLPRQSPPALWLILGMSALGLSILLPRLYVLAVVAAIAGWVLVIVTLGSLTQGRVDWIVLGWITFFPLGYYFLSFPATRPLFTLDRAVIALLILGAISIGRPRAFPMLTDVRVAGWWWLGFLVISLLSIWELPYSEMIPPLRILIDSFAMPAFLCWLIMCHFDVRKNLAWLHACSCIMSAYIWAIGFAELVTGRNLLQFTDTTQFTQSGDVKLMRVDGPFESGTSYALIGIIGFFFILYLRRYLPKRLPVWQATLHWVGVLAALGVGLMPMHRGLVVALIAVCLVDYFSNIHLVSRRSWQVLWLFLLAGIVTAKILVPELYSDRVTGTDNIYSRLAQHKQTVQVITDHPIIGVGIDRFYTAVSMSPRYFTSFRGFDSMNFAHNTILLIAAETGILGLMCYLLAQFFFARAIWRTRKINPLGCETFFCLFMIYTIFGLDVTVGYFSDINLWYMLTFGVITQLQARSVAEALQLRSGPNV